MTAKFIGADYSMGLRTGVIYPIEISTGDNGKYIWVKIRNPQTHETKLCPYSSLAKLNENWK